MKKIDLFRKDKVGKQVRKKLNKEEGIWERIKVKKARMNLKWVDFKMVK